MSKVKQLNCFKQLLITVRKIRTAAYPKFDSSYCLFTIFCRMVYHCIIVLFFYWLGGGGWLESIHSYSPVSLCSSSLLREKLKLSAAADAPLISEITNITHYVIHYYKSFTVQYIVLFCTRTVSY